MIGSLVISSKGTPEQLPIFSSPQQGNRHEPSPRGTWWFEAPEATLRTIYLPQRDRTVQVHYIETNSSNFNWEEHMGAWDVADNLSYYEKLDNLRINLPSEITSCSIYMNIANTQGAWSVIRNSPAPIYLFGISSYRTDYLVWSTEDIVNSLRKLEPTKYNVFRFAEITNQVFLNTTAICSKWWRWGKRFELDKLKMYNALDVMLLKVR